MLLSSAIGVYLGVEVWTFALALAVGLIAARLPGIRREGTEIATTAIFLLAAGFTEDTPALVERVVEVGLGVGIGVLVNLLVMPPLRDAQASQTVDDLNQRMGAVMEQMGQDFAESWGTDRSRSWFEATEDMRNDLARSWDAVRFAEESRRRNPRRLLHRDSGESYENILFRLDEGIAHLRNLARTLDSASYAESGWDDRFREQWAAAVSDAGVRIANPDAEVEPTADRLDRLARDMAGDDLPEAAWPVYGALMTSLRNIVDIVDDVASAREVREAG